jgi:adenine-specific DNA methylase
MIPGDEEPIPRMKQRYPLLDFFAGSGLVSEALKTYFTTVWANDISEKKGCSFLRQ